MVLNMAKTAVLGSGGWGTALAILCHNNGHDVVLWGKFEDEINNLIKTRENPLLKNVKIPQEIKLSCDINDVSSAQFVIIATPSFAVGETAQRLSGVINPEAIVISVAKGFERNTLKQFTTVIKEQLPYNEVVALSGPSHAEEVAIEVPTSVVVASKNLTAAKKVQKALMNDYFRIYTNDDIIGVETGAALKNIIAMAVGICDGMGLGDNSIAALITRGIKEMSVLGEKMGGKRETFAGLSGVGDLIVTCTSRHSRNRRFGKAIGEGMSVEQALKEVGMTVESYYATAAAKLLSERYNVEMPIVNECYDILYNGAKPKLAVKKLMCRSMKHEI